MIRYPLYVTIDTNIFDSTGYDLGDDGTLGHFDNKSIFYNMKTYYKAHTQKDNGLAGCMECGQCENICPQKISIRKYFGEIKQLFE